MLKHPPLSLSILFYPHAYSSILTHLTHILKHLSSPILINSSTPDSMANYLRNCRIGNCSFQGTRSDLAKHWQLCHRERNSSGDILCAVCQSSISKKNASRHYKTYHPGIRPPPAVQVKCEICFRTFPEHSIARHKLTHAKSTAQLGTCKFCNMRFDKRNLPRHEQQHQAREKFPEESQDQPLDSQALQQQQQQQQQQQPPTQPASIMAYQESQEEKIRFVSRRLEDLMRSAVGPYKKRLEDYHCIIRNTTCGMAADAETYLQTQKGDFVMCSPHDALRILEIGPLRVPIFIPGDLAGNHNRSDSLPKFFSLLKLLRTVDAQYQGEAGYHHQPIQQSTKNVIEDFLSHEKGPVNLLNLQGNAYDPPQCLSQDRFCILDDIKSEAGKQATRNPADLSSCTRFRICGSQDSHSLPHIDQHGVITSIFNNDGEKLWPMWPHLSTEDISQWASSDTDPEPGAVGIYLRAGDLLIQPSGTLHAPWSITNVLMTGTMHWDVQDMVKTLELVKLCLQSEHVSNEEVAKEFEWKVGCVSELWKERTGPWKWPSSDQLEQFDVLKDEVKALLATRQRSRKPRRKR